MKYALILFISLLPVLVHAQQPDDLVHWNKRHQLSWSDYQGKPEANATAAASTATYLSVEYSFKDGKLGYIITCSFSRSKSWGLHKNDYILAHEQGHFDIAEIFARKLHQRLKEYQFDKKTYQTDLRDIYENTMDDKEEMQNKYDRETNHSINREKQAEWLQRIGSELEKLSGFANY
ncbi:DUF922 domain-containing Zn-dependent protease [Terrimonas sp. NA20]|uniref:DUF922 domain-containing Zn-dependent protease n=1 Tax=Terrimonas ginsenosidimutans TaxID=2908004 RepID=A0ABS9KQ09_9BACT|nr:DUF922 domain-containing protein [Terrimonas ginsenosidimutans]MCG2614355.1 DUF922 domain-containing Zn-dependent protease [Terrimonas ginsenosidimutans]